MPCHLIACQTTLQVAYTFSINCWVISIKIIQYYLHTLSLLCSTIFWQIIILQAFEKIKRIQLQRYHSVDDPEKKASIETNPLKIFHAAINNSTPVLQLTPIKRGGVTYQVGYFWNGIGSDCKSGRLNLHNVATDAKRLFKSKYNYSCSTVKSTSMSL